MGRILEGIKIFFTEDDWKFTEIEGRGAIRMGFSGDNAQWNCFAQAREEQEQIVFYSVAAFQIPEERRTEAALFIARANYGMIIGNFEIDLGDGEVRYKTAADFEGTELTSALIKPLVYANVLTMDRYVKGLMAVGFGGKSAEEAIAEVEG